MRTEKSDLQLAILHAAAVAMAGGGARITPVPYPVIWGSWDNGGANFVASASYL